MNADRSLPQQSAACRVKGEGDPAFARGEHDPMPACRGVDRRDLQVPVMEVVGECMVIPFKLARALIDLDYAVGIQFATLICLSLLLREIGIADAGIDRLIRADQYGVPGT